MVILALAVLGNFVTFPATVWGGLLNFLLSPVALVVIAGVAGLCVKSAKGGLRK